MKYITLILAFVTVPVLAQQVGVQAGSQSGAQSGSVSIVDNRDSSQHEINNDYPVGTALAPSIQGVGGDDSCLGASGVGISTGGFGFSGGSTFPSEHCILLRQAKFAAALNDRELVSAIMCQDRRWREAFEALGRTCPESKTRAHVRFVDEQPTPGGPRPQDKIFEQRRGDGR